MNYVNGIARDQLRVFVERIELLDEDHHDKAAQRFVEGVCGERKQAQRPGVKT